MTPIEGGRGPASSGELQFDKAEMGAGAARTCGHCRRTIDAEYFAIGRNVVCAACAQTLGGSGDRASFVRALGYGSGAALIGTLIWLLVMKLSGGSEFGLIAIGVGLFVGFAVRKGSRGLGGRKYQALAVALTYVSITSSYVPLVLKAVAEKPQNTAEANTTADGTPEQTPAAASAENQASALTLVVGFALVFGIAFAAPFLAGASNIMGLFIIGIALYEAWKINRLTPIAGPFRVGMSASTAGATGPPLVPPSP